MFCAAFLSRKSNLLDFSIKIGTQPSLSWFEQSLVISCVKERELMSKKLSKYMASFDYFDKSLIVLSVTTGSISIPSVATIIGAPVGIISASFSLSQFLQ